MLEEHASHHVFVFFCWLMINWTPKAFYNWNEKNFSSAEIERIETGFESDKFIELHQNPAKVEFRVRLPVKEYPQVCGNNKT